MKDFPEFLKNPRNRADPLQQYSGQEAEGYVFDGIDGSQMIAWRKPTASAHGHHTHDFDEYFIVVEGTYTGDIGGRHVELARGDECLIKSGTPHRGRFSEGFRGIFALLTVPTG